MSAEQNITPLTNSFNMPLTTDDDCSAAQGKGLSAVSVTRRVRSAAGIKQYSSMAQPAIWKHTARVETA